MKLWDVRNYLRKIRDGCDAMIEGINQLEKISNLANCNDCGAVKKCQYKPKWGEPVRYNCPLWVGSKGGT